MQRIKDNNREADPTKQVLERKRIPKEINTPRHQTNIKMSKNLYQEKGNGIGGGAVNQETITVSEAGRLTAMQNHLEEV